MGFVEGEGNGQLHESREPVRTPTGLPAEGIFDVSAAVKRMTERRGQPLWQPQPTIGRRLTYRLTERIADVPPPDLGQEVASPDPLSATEVDPI